MKTPRSAHPRRTSAFLLGLALLCGALVVALPFPAVAGPPATPFVVALQQPAAADGFVPVYDLPQDEQLPAAPLLVGAYAFAWVMLLGYVWGLWRRLTKVEREMSDVARRIEELRRG
jgi:CcmD family protein